MKKIKILFATLLVGLFSVSVYAQTNYVSKFNASSVQVQSQIFDNGTYVGIGNNTPFSGAKLRVDYNESLSSGSRNYIMAELSANGVSGICDVSGRLGQVVVNSNNAGISSVRGIVTNLTQVGNSGSVTSTVVGGRFENTINDPVVSAKAANGEYYIGGSISQLSGSITTYPSIGAVAAVIGQDNINASGTYAGYFQGKGHFTGDLSTEGGLNVDGTGFFKDFVYIGFTDPSLDGELRVFGETHVLKASNSNNVKVSSVGQNKNSGAESRLLYTIPWLGDGGYTSLAEEGDVGLIWTDLEAASNRNLDAGLVIAPHNVADRGIRIAANGHVQVGAEWYTGTGTLTEDARMSVDGALIAKEVLVTTTGWADYVFEDDYQLMDMNTLASYIEVNNHLPDVPCTDEVMDQGVNIGEMQAILLKKIEELTLYTLQQQQQIESLKSEIQNTKG